VLAFFISFERAREVYRVAFTGEALDDSLEIDWDATARLRKSSNEREVETT
jgi:hypothetical protein